MFCSLESNGTGFYKNILCCLLIFWLHQSWIFKYWCVQWNVICNKFKIKVNVLRIVIWRFSPRLPLNLLSSNSFWQWNIFKFEGKLMHCFSSYAVLVLKRNAFLQSSVSASVTSNGLQFQNAFCNYNICHVCKFLNFSFSVLLMNFFCLIKIKCCLLSCIDFILRYLCLSLDSLYVCVSSASLPSPLPFGIKLCWILLLTVKSSPWTLDFFKFIIDSMWK